jgi:hypothetical protein
VSDYCVDFIYALSELFWWGWAGTWLELFGVLRYTASFNYSEPQIKSQKTQDHGDTTKGRVMDHAQKREVGCSHDPD